MPAKKYKKEYCQKLIEHMRKGYSFYSFGAKPLSVGRATLDDWVLKYPEFEEAKSIGTNESLKFWEKIGLKGLTGKYKGGFSASTYIFNMKNRFKWTDRTDLRVSSDEIPKEEREKHAQLKAIDRKKLIALAKVS